MKNKLLYTTILGVFAFIISPLYAQTSPDAIAIRVMQNPNHYSALRWYQEKHFTGSPQSIVVDGYNGIRDGRTVYVNAANVVNGKLYTNIYLISYNQTAENATVDIFGKMVMHWKFNANISDPEEKARVVRDVIRMERLNDIDYFLSQYKATKGHYPELNAGSYIKNVSISTWPSWQDVLARELKAKLPIDPIDKIGACPANFNPKTCWDEKQRKFADINPGDPQINLPTGSNIFLYQTDGEGAAYNLCAVMESDYAQVADDSACNASKVYQLIKIKDGHTPQFNGLSLPVINSGLDFTGYVRAIDPDGDDLVWSFDFSPASQWSSWGGGVAPIVTNTFNVNEKKITSPKAGRKGFYSFTARISDGTATTTQTFTINVVNSGPTVLSSDKEYVASTTNPFFTSFKVYDLEVNYPLSRTITYGVDFLASSLQNNFEMIAPDNEEYLFSFSGVLIPDNSRNVAGLYPFVFEARDSYDEATSKTFNVKVINNPPVITTPLNCNQIVRWGSQYPQCQIKATDPDGNLVNKFELTQSVASIGINNAGLIQGVPSYESIGIHQLDIRATDEYGATSSVASYDLHVNSYCGDNKKQNPNTESRGGINNDGQEQCDGSDNIALIPGESSQNKQYECSGSCATGVIACNGCIAVGGWCGDGSVQSNHGEECEDGQNTAANPEESSETRQYDCTDTCQSTGGYCGNAILESTEQCDNGNNDDAGSCAHDCTWTVKGLLISNFSSAVMGGQGSSGDGVFYDNNNSSTVTVNQPDVSPYNYLKLSGIQKTPYAWLSAMYENTLVKMRTYTGPRRNCVNNGAITNCSWDLSNIENQGQSLGTFSTGGQRPGRTAVNVETGDVWVHNRYEQSVSKIDINGNIKKTCNIDPAFNLTAYYVMTDCDGNPDTPNVDAYNGGTAHPSCWYAGGGVSIAENGDVWAGNYYTGVISRIPGGDSDGCTPIKKINTGGNVYGLAIDSVGNLWANTRNMKVTKIDTTTMTVSTYPLSYDIYGITVDAGDNVWGGSYDGVPNNGVGGMQKLPKNSPANTALTVYNFGNDVTGVSIDSFNGVWGSGYDDLNIVEIDKNTGLAKKKLNCGVYIHGVSGNSEGDVFGVGVNDAKVYFFDATVGNSEGTYCVFGDCHTAAIYTYSDMAGLNRAMVLRSGNWLSQVFDSGYSDQHWGKLTWDQIIPSTQQKVEIYVGIGNDANNLTFKTVADWNAQADPAATRQGRYVQVKILMRSNQLGVSPVVSNIRFNAN